MGRTTIFTHEVRQIGKVRVGLLDLCDLGYVPSDGDNLFLSEHLVLDYHCAKLVTLNLFVDWQTKYKADRLPYYRTLKHQDYEKKHG